MDLRYGVKIYDNDWFLRHKLTPVEAADLLADWGVNYVIAQSKLLPMSNSAVASSVTAGDRDAYESLDDIAFREMLRQRGISYFACLNICFDPSFSAAHPELAAIDQTGAAAAVQDWYIGIPPDRQENLQQKIGLLQKAVAQLKPDAVHLGFIRWPGFWETWLEGDVRAQKPEYCFSKQTVELFNQDTGLSVPSSDPAAAAKVLSGPHRQVWSQWKCAQTVKGIAAIRQSLSSVQSDLKYSINTLPFFKNDFDNAVEEVFGQNIAMLAEVVDIFEVMAYHQILAKPPTWPAAVATDILARSGRQAICTLQVRALYLEGMHAARGRRSEISATEFATALDAVAMSPVDGACVFTFTDLIDMRETEAGRVMLTHLSNFRRAG